MSCEARFVEVVDLKTNKPILIQLGRVRRIHREPGKGYYFDVSGNSDPSNLSSFDYMMSDCQDLESWNQALNDRFVDVILPGGQAITVNKIYILTISFDPFIIEIVGKGGPVSCTKLFDTSENAINWYRAQKLF